MCANKFASASILCITLYMCDLLKHHMLHMKLHRYKCNFNFMYMQYD